MVEMATAAGLPRPEIEERGDAVIVRFHHGRTGSGGVEDERAPARTEVLVLLGSAAEGMTRKEILSALRGSVSEAQLRRMLEELRDEGLVRRRGTREDGVRGRQDGALRG